MFSSEDRASIERAAESRGIDARSMLALGLTESNGRVSWAVNGNKVPAIRPEVHVFYRELKNLPNLQRLAVDQGLAHPKRNGVKLPRSYEGRYQFYNRMAEIHSEAAAASTSFGWGQVMGFNYEMLGLSSPTDVAVTALTVEGQTKLVAMYIEETGLTPFMNNLPSQSSAERIARVYNGPKWRENKYASKLISNWKIAGAGGIESAGQSVADLQTALSKLGYDPGRIDGAMGLATRAAVKAYQTDNGLHSDGDAGPMTWEALEEDLSELQVKAQQKSKDKVGSVGIGVGGIAILSELMGEMQGMKDSVMELVSGFSVPAAYLQIAIALIVSYVVYTRFFKK